MRRRRFFSESSALAGLALAARSAQLAGAQSAFPRLRLGQVGTAHAHAAGKLQSAKALTDLFEVVGVAEPDEAQWRTVSTQDAYSDVPQMSLERLLPQVDLVLVETDIDELLPMGLRCLQAGKHIHLDKPAGTSLPEFQELIELARTRGLQVQMGYMYRSNPAFQFLFQAAELGWLGEIFEVHAVMSKQVGVAERLKLARYRGGSMFELGCHLIDALVHLMGAPARVVPFNRQTYASSTNEFVGELYDNCLAVFEYPRATATIRSSLVEVDGGKRRQFVVCGTQGTVSIRPLEPAKLELTLDKPVAEFKRGTQSVVLPAMKGRYDEELRSLAAAIRGEKPLAQDYDHDLMVHRCVLQASGML